MINIITTMEQTYSPAPGQSRRGFEDAAGNGEIHVYPC